LKLEFTVLGSGCYAAAAKGAARTVRNPAGYALSSGEEILLFDFGFGNLRQMTRAGLDPNKVSHVFLTHRHPDHVGDLPALLFYYRYDGKPRGGKLHIHGPRGTKSFVQRLTKAHHPWLRPRGFTMTVTELEEPMVVRGPGWRVHCREVPHTTEALAYRFESRQGGVCYSGDTSYDPGLAAFAKGAELFVLECTLGDRQRLEGHLRVSQALTLAKAADARRTLLTHLSPASERDLGRRLRGLKNIAKAEDLLKIRISRR
jgi:ribonuclease BN (tRNA processing enzyme)